MYFVLLSEMYKLVFRVQIMNLIAKKCVQINSTEVKCESPVTIINGFHKDVPFCNNQVSVALKITV